MDDQKKRNGKHSQHSRIWYLVLAVAGVLGFLKDRTKPCLFLLDRSKCIINNYEICSYSTLYILLFKKIV